MLSRFISSVFKGDKQQGAAQYFIHSVSGPDGGGGVHTRQQHGHVPGLQHPLTALIQS